jgi:hypothetical protein
MDREIMMALEADGEKLRQLTVKIARMLAISWDCEVPSWDQIMVRLNECLTTFRN